MHLRTKWGLNTNYHSCHFPLCILVQRHISMTDKSIYSDTQKVCGLNGNSCNPFTSPNDWWRGVRVNTTVQRMIYIWYIPTYFLANQIFHFIKTWSPNRKYFLNKRVGVWFRDYQIWVGDIQTKPQTLLTVWSFIAY